MTNFKIIQKKGSVLYYSVVILSLLLAMVLGLSSIIAGQIKTVRTIEYSLQSFYAADAGIEEAFYEFYENGTPIENIDVSGYFDLNENGSKDSNEPTYETQGLSSTEIKSSGFYQNNRRAIQVSF